MYKLIWRTFFLLLPKIIPSKFLAEQRARSNEQRAKSNKQRSNSNEQRAKSNAQRAKNNEQQAKSFISVAGSFIQEMNQTSGNKKLLFTYLPFFRAF